MSAVVSLVDRADASHPEKVKYVNVYLGNYESLNRLPAQELIRIIQGQAEMMARVPKLIEELDAVRKEQTGAANVITKAYEHMTKQRDEILRLKNEIAASHAQQMVNEEAAAMASLSLAEVKKKAQKKKSKRNSSQSG